MSFDVDYADGNELGLCESFVIRDSFKISDHTSCTLELKFNQGYSVDRVMYVSPSYVFDIPENVYSCATCGRLFSRWALTNAFDPVKYPDACYYVCKHCYLSGHIKVMNMIISFGGRF